MADHPRLTIHFTRCAPMDLDVFIAVARRRHAALSELHAHTQHAEPFHAQDQATSEIVSKRKRGSHENHARREEARVKRRKERDSIKQRRIQALDIRLQEIREKKKNLLAKEDEIIKQKDALFARKQELADNMREMLATTVTVPSSPPKKTPPTKRSPYLTDPKNVHEEKERRMRACHHSMKDSSSSSPSSNLRPMRQHQSPEKNSRRSSLPLVSGTSLRMTIPTNGLPPSLPSTDTRDLPPHLQTSTNHRSRCSSLEKDGGGAKVRNMGRTEDETQQDDEMTGRI